jgi:hypothetical protein
VPEFGAFLTRKIAAYYNPQTQSFYPPSKGLSFNGQLQTSDGVLVSYIASVQGCSYDQAQDQLTRVVNQWKADLANGLSLDLEHIGLISKNEEGHIVFKPYHDHNYLNSSFGLAPVSAALIEKATQPIVRQLTPESQADFKIGKSLMKYAAVGLIAISTALGGLQLRSSYENNSVLAAKSAQETIEKTIQEASFFSDNPVDLPVLEVEVSIPKDEMHYFIIAGSFIKEENALAHIEKLKKKGFDTSEIIGQNPFGLYQVGLNAFAGEPQARAFLATARANGNESAWLLVK